MESVRTADLSDGRETVRSTLCDSWGCGGVRVGGLFYVLLYTVQEGRRRTLGPALIWVLVVAIVALLALRL